MIVKIYRGENGFNTLSPLFQKFKEGKKNSLKKKNYKRWKGVNSPPPF
jgi:hypothetical protein